jgi:hypothetical protein
MVIKALKSGMRLFSNKLHYHSSICQQIVGEVRRSLNQSEEAEEIAYMRTCEKKLIDQLDPLINYGISKGVMKPPCEQSSGN